MVLTRVHNIEGNIGYSMPIEIFVAFVFQVKSLVVAISNISLFSIHHGTFFASYLSNV